MAVVTGYTADHMDAIQAACVIGGEVDGDNLTLMTFGGTPIDAGNVRGPQGDQGVKGDTGAQGPGNATDTDVAALVNTGGTTTRAAVDSRVTAGISSLTTRVVTLETLNKNYCVLRNNAGLTLTTATFTAVPWDTEDSDGLGMHDPAHATRVIAGAPGWYDLDCQINFNNNSTGTRSIQLRKNGSAVSDVNVLLQMSAASGLGSTYHLSGPVHLGSSDYMEIWASQSSGGNLTVTANSWLKVKLALAD